MGNSVKIQKSPAHKVFFPIHTKRRNALSLLISVLLIPTSIAVAHLGSTLMIFQFEASVTEIALTVNMDTKDSYLPCVVLIFPIATYYFALIYCRLPLKRTKYLEKATQSKLNLVNTSVSDNTHYIQVYSLDLKHWLINDRKMSRRDPRNIESSKYYKVPRFISLVANLTLMCSFIPYLCLIVIKAERILTYDEIFSVFSIYCLIVTAVIVINGALAVRTLSILLEFTFKNSPQITKKLVRTKRESSWTETFTPFKSSVQNLAITHFFFTVCFLMALTIYTSYAVSALNLSSIAPFWITVALYLFGISIYAIVPYKIADFMRKPADILPKSLPNEFLIQLNPLKGISGRSWFAGIMVYVIWGGISLVFPFLMIKEKMYTTAIIIIVVLHVLGAIIIFYNQIQVMRFFPAFQKINRDIPSVFYRVLPVEEFENITGKKLK